jgi:hypothetical protein
MASGYYPIGKYDDIKPYELLSLAMRNIAEARKEIGIADDQYDNAADDGAYAFRLILAEQLVGECLK